MSMGDLERALDLIVANMDRADFEGQKSEEIIASAEAALGVHFPATYRAFLSKCGCGDFAGHEFYGIIGDDFYNSGVPDAVWITLKEREESGLPNHLVVVYDQGDGAYYALDCFGSNVSGESPVVVWVPGASRKGDRLEVVAEDFGGLLLEKIQSSL
ncbi:MAG: SMI1/KNR4 family protein [Pseudomonadota bacterium]